MKRLFARVGEQAFHIVSTEFDHFIAHYDHVTTRIVRAVIGAERFARRDGVLASVAHLCYACHDNY